MYRARRGMHINFKLNIIIVFKCRKQGIGRIKMLTFNKKMLKIIL